MNTITLKDILEVFNAPVSEEQCWAILNEAALYLLEQLSSDKTAGLKFSGLDCVRFDNSGIICIVFGSQLNSEKEENLVNLPLEQELLRCLGIVVFHALDYGLSEAEEHVLSESMESLLDRMVSGEEDDREQQPDGEHDEGIVQDGGCKDSLTLARVIELCHSHLSEPLSAPTHYKAVCRAMVTEAIELMAFLKKMSQEKAKINKIDDANPEFQMQQAEWARLWMQVVRQLRDGITLRKVKQLNLPRIEYELTPYEMLLDDIRARRYILNKVPCVDVDPVKVESTAHDVILNFIRSRPTLLPVQHRQLRDLSPPERGVRERMLDAIKQEPRLRSAPNLATLNHRMSLDETALTLTQPRKVIKPDLSLIQAYSFDTEAGLSDDDDVYMEDKNRVVPPPITPFTPLSPTKTTHSHWSNTEHAVEPSSRKFFSFLERRHSASSYDNLTDAKQPVAFDPNISAPLWNAILTGTNSILNRPVSLPAADCLSLTIEEVMHIRRVLAKAELESLIVHPELYQLVSKGKVCFTCLKTKFAILGPWGIKCHICARIVCSRCMQKMRVPTDHFERIPVHSLSPGVLSPQLDSNSVQGSSGSKAAVSPRGDNEQGVSNKVAEELERARSVVFETSQKLFEGPVMNICLDCRAMLLEIIRASRLSATPLLETAPRPLSYQLPNVAVDFQ